MGKNNKKGESTKKQEVAKNNEEEVNETANPVVENQVEQEEPVTGESVEQNNEQPTASTEEQPKAEVQESAEDWLPKKPRFTKKNGETEKRVLEVAWMLDCAVELVKRIANLTDDERNEMVRDLTTAKLTIQERNAEQIKVENEQLAVQLEDDKKKRSEEKTAKQKRDDSIKMLIGLGYTEEQATAIIDKKQQPEQPAEE
ncbi:MAG: hypothetical protein II604_07595 [Bacteroidales bacterium]|nr:hypothetical protein [Bacteroidales bacterium]